MQFSLRLTSGFLKRFYAKRMFYGWWKLALCAVVSIALVFMDMRRGDIGMVSIVSLSAMGLYLVVSGIAWYRQSRALNDWLQKQGDAPVIYSLELETVESASNIGSTKLKWDAFRSLVITDFDTLLTFPHHGCLTLPTAQLPAETLDFLKNRFAAHGKKIDDKRKPQTAGLG